MGNGRKGCNGWNRQPGASGLPARRCAASPPSEESQPPRHSHLDCRCVLILIVARHQGRRHGNHGMPPILSTNAFQRTENASPSGDAARSASSGHDLPTWGRDHAAAREREQSPSPPRHYRDRSRSRRLCWWATHRHGQRRSRKVARGGSPSRSRWEPGVPLRGETKLPLRPSPAASASFVGGNRKLHIRDRRKLRSDVGLVICTDPPWWRSYMDGALQCTSGARGCC